LKANLIVIAEPIDKDQAREPIVLAAAIPPCPKVAEVSGKNP
jgi:hypothetical protein